MDFVGDRAPNPGRRAVILHGCPHVFLLPRRTLHVHEADCDQVGTDAHRTAEHSRGPREQAP